MISAVIIPYLPFGAPNGPMLRGPNCGKPNNVLKKKHTHTHAEINIELKIITINYLRTYGEKRFDCNQQKKKIQTSIFF